MNILKDDEARSFDGKPFEFHDFIMPYEGPNICTICSPLLTLIHQFNPFTTMVQCTLMGFKKLDISFSQITTICELCLFIYFLNGVGLCHVRHRMDGKYLYIFHWYDIHISLAWILLWGLSLRFFHISRLTHIEFIGDNQNWQNTSPHLHTNWDLGEKQEENKNK